MKCKDCKYYYEDHITSECRRYPPSWLKEHSCFPDTSAHSWCGEFKSKKITSGKKTIEPSEIEIKLLEKLNKEGNRQFRPTDSNLKHIRARLAEGYKPEDIAAVIWYCCNASIFFEENKKYLRPETLFSASKFGGYLGEANDYERKNT